jgi:hypothetical protein
LIDLRFSGAKIIILSFKHQQAARQGTAVLMAMIEVVLNWAKLENFNPLPKSQL